LRLQQLQREFIASVSHELRTPLTAIAGARVVVNPMPISIRLRLSCPGVLSRLT